MKLYKIKALMVCIICLFYYHAKAQINPLQPGDTVPGHLLKKLKASNAFFYENNERGNKLTILNFFSVGCGNSIRSLVELNRLQHFFKDKLAVASITAQKQEEYTAAKKRRSDIGHINLPVITGDTFWRQFFPFVQTPHIVVIDAQGKIIGITYIEYVTKAVIENLIAGGKPAWALKKDVIGYDRSLPLMQATNNAGVVPAIQYYSAFSTHIPGISFFSSGKIIDSASSIKRYFYRNFSILSLYKNAISYHNHIKPAHYKIEVKEKDKLSHNPKTSILYDWAKDHLFTYEIVMPLHTTDEEISTKMLFDLNNYLGYNGRIEKQKIDVLVMVQKKPIKKRSIDNAGSVTINSLISSLNFLENSPPVLDGTGGHGGKRLQIKYERSMDLALLEEDLRAQGYTLKKRRRKLDIFVLDDKTLPGK